MFLHTHMHSNPFHKLASQAKDHLWHEESGRYRGPEEPSG